MAEFKAGDRVVKMSGTAAGKYGTVNSVAENGTLNVTFDGERLPRYCDLMRCGQVAANAKFKKGDRVKVPGIGKTVITEVKPTVIGTVYYVDIGGGRSMAIPEYDIRAANAARNAAARNGEKRLRTAEDKNGNVIRVGDMVKIDGGKKGKVESIWEYDGEGPYVIIAGSLRPVKSYLLVTKV